MSTQLPTVFDSRVTRDLGVRIPIVQAPMGWIARSQLASAVSATGACGIIETSSGELDAGLNRHALPQPTPLPALRALRTDRTEALVRAEHNVFGDFGDPQSLCFGGDMNAGIALSGQVAGRIESVRPVAELVAAIVRLTGA